MGRKNCARLDFNSFPEKLSGLCYFHSDCLCNSCLLKACLREYVKFSFDEHLTVNAFCPVTLEIENNENITQRTNVNNVKAETYPTQYSLLCEFMFFLVFVQDFWTKQIIFSFPRIITFIELLPSHKIFSFSFSTTVFHQFFHFEFL